MAKTLVFKISLINSKCYIRKLFGTECAFFIVSTEMCEPDLEVVQYPPNIAVQKLFFVTVTNKMWIRM